MMCLRNKYTIIHERMKRQRFLQPIPIEDEEDYMSLFKLVQPVAPIHFSRPGEPPRLVHRTDLSDRDLAQRLRAKHRVVKGRFAAGRVGYVLQEDLSAYATAFRKSLKNFKSIHADLLNVIRTSGGMSKEQLKDELPYSGPEITKALVAMQGAFIVYEDQIDDQWDTGWFDFAREWAPLPDIDDLQHSISAVSVVLFRYVKAMVFANLQQMKDWSQINQSLLKHALRNLMKAKQVVQVEIEHGETGFMCESDGHLLDVTFSEEEYTKQLHSVYMLDKSDIVVRSNMSKLKERYHGLEQLQYLLIDGEIKGAVCGHWRIGPHDIEDIVLDLKKEEALNRKDEILQAVRKVYHPESTSILKYNGDKLC